jgi:hypothetical protein
MELNKRVKNSAKSGRIEGKCVCGGLIQSYDEGKTWFHMGDLAGHKPILKSK